jgi:uncharacterized RDD family membrane protein YckC
MIVRVPELGRISLPLADLGSRLAALLLDGAVLVACDLVLVGLAALDRSLPRAVSGYPLAAALALGVGLSFLYFMLYEGLRDGATPGKRALGLSVRREDGGAIGLEEAVLRNLLRPVDLATGVGLAFIGLSHERQRLGDLLAGTVVVRLPRPVDRPLVDLSDAPVLERNVAPSARWLALATSFVARAERLSDERRRALAERLAARVDAAWAESGLDAETFVKAVLRQAARPARRSDEA